MISRRTFLKTTGLVLGAGALPASAKVFAPQKTVLLQCAWATKNIGDIGHTPGTLRFLEQYLPEAKVILWAANTNPQVDAMLNKRFPKVEIVKGSLSQKDGAVQKAIERSDFFLRGPGMGQPTDFMKYCNKIGKPWGLQGQSYFPDMVTGPGADGANCPAQQRGFHLLPRLQNTQNPAGRRREAARSRVRPRRLFWHRRPRRREGPGPPGQARPRGEEVHHAATSHPLAVQPRRR